MDYVMSDLTRTSVLASRHAALGSGLEDWNGMGTAWSYGTDPDDEHDAIRERAGLFDMSPLKKVFVRGPDAARVVDHVITRDMRRVAPGQSAYGAILTEQGTVCDDAIVANNGGDEWMHCHGSGESMARLQESAAGLDVAIAGAFTRPATAADQQTARNLRDVIGTGREQQRIRPCHQRERRSRHRPAVGRLHQRRVGCRQQRVQSRRIVRRRKPRCIIHHYFR